MDFKRIFPIEINYSVKHFILPFRNLRTKVEFTKSASGKRVFFLDTPAYENMGDQAICLAMKSFIADVLPEYGQIEVTEDRLPYNLKILKTIVKPDDIICLSGGGNMGTLYQRYEAVRRFVIRSFPQNAIIIFPQTIDYGEDAYSRRERDRAVRVYARAKNLILCARERESYEQMKLYFPKANVLFCPDIALYLDYRDRFERTNNVGLCLRHDQEQLLSNDDVDFLRKCYPACLNITTFRPEDAPVTQENRRAVVEKTLRDFGSKRLVITDRLHGMIFAFITNTPCIALPSTNGKIKRVSQYLSQIGNVQYAGTVSDMMEPAGFSRNGSMRDEFGVLKNAIQRIANG